MNNLLSVTQKLTILAFIILIVLSPSIHFIPHIEFHDCQRILQLILLALILINTTTSTKNPKIIPINKSLRIGFYIILILAVISSYTAIAPRHAIIEVSVLSALCYLSLFTATLYNEQKEQLVKYLVYAIWLGLLLYMVSFYVGYITAITFQKKLVWPFPFYGFSNIRLFQQYQLWGLGLISLPLLTFNLKKSIRFSLYIALAAWWVLLFYAASRGVILGWVLGLILTAIVYKKVAWPFLRTQLINAFTGLVAYQFLFKIVPSWITPDTTTATSNSVATSTIFRALTSDRIDLWKVSLVMIDNFPLLGVGPMHFYWYNQYGTHPHNSVLQLAAEFGLPAACIMLAIITYGFVCWFKRFNLNQLKNEADQNRLLTIVLFFTITANGAYSLVEGVIVMPISQVLMSIVIGLMIGQYSFRGNYQSNDRITQKRLQFRPIFAMIVLIALAWSTMPEIKRGLTYTQRNLIYGERAFSMAPGRINPRIWMQQRREESKQ